MQNDPGFPPAMRFSMQKTSEIKFFRMLHSFKFEIKKKKQKQQTIDPLIS